MHCMQLGYREHGTSTPYYAEDWTVITARRGKDYGRGRMSGHR